MAGFALTFLVICATVASSHRFSRDDLTMDELLIDSLKSSKDLSLIHSNNTLLVELDMIITMDEYMDKHSREKRGALRDPEKRWPGGVLPYKLTDYHYSAIAQNDIKSVFKIYEQHTCLRFVPYDESRHEGAITFNSEYGCSAPAGFWRGHFYKNFHQMNMHQGCLDRGTLLHELGHVIGLKHEQTRPDRDEWITLDKDNVEGDSWDQFEKWGYDLIDSHGIPYDYMSIMHYGKYAFARSLSPTIKTNDPYYQNLIGQRYSLTLDDIHVINLMYDCLGHCPRQKRCPPGGVMDINCECQCRIRPTFTVQNQPGFPCNQGRTEDSPDCHDVSRYCGEAALAGKCDSERYDMLTDCRRTCGFCQIAPPAPTPAPTRPPRPKPDPCKDTSYFLNDCRQYKANGNCDTPTGNYPWLKLHCQKTCGFCTPRNSGRMSFRQRGSSSGGACEDEYGEECESYIASGSCDSGPYMNVLRKHCKKTCGLCGAAGRRQLCVDKASARQCGTWKRAGECQTNPTEMEHLCKNTCSRCNRRAGFSGGSGKCEDLNESCGPWAEKTDLCTVKRKYMMVNCRKSCGFCQTAG